jgi:hypothetical protein
MYTISYPSGTIRKDGVVVPQDDRTPEYQQYVAFLQSGGTVEQEQDESPSRPRIEVSAWQIRKALNREGLRDAVEAYVASSGDLELQDGYYHAPTFWSDHPFALVVGAALGKSEDAMYEFFQLAKSL